CGPCLRIAPAFNSLSNKYPQATFLEVDVHQCQGTAATNNISATPTFLFFRNKVRVDQYQGADAVGLEEKIKQHLENDPGSTEDSDIPRGYMDLLPFINKAGCECLNESDEHGFDNCLRKDCSYLQSDCDEQVRGGGTPWRGAPGGEPLEGTPWKGPPWGELCKQSSLKRSSWQGPLERELLGEMLSKGSVLASSQLFVQSNHGDEETTRISYFTFIGTPVQATNMNDFKRVVGKKGESH
ncbi:Thioredoxin-like 1, partial [Dryobates pubescens]